MRTSHPQRPATDPEDWPVFSLSSNQIKTVIRFFSFMASVATVLAFINGAILWQQDQARRMRAREIQAQLAPVEREIAPLLVLPAQVHSLRAQLAEDHRRLLSQLAESQAEQLRAVHRIESKVRLRKR